MNFNNFYSWLKYTALPPSFVFKNRLFLEKTFRNNHIFPFLGETHKSFSWNLISTTNISSFWFSVSYLRLLFIALIIFLSLYFYINTGWKFSTSPATYLIWRLLDLAYLFIVQIQYVFITTVVSFIFFLSNLFVSSNLSFIRWMRKNHAEILTVSNSKDAVSPLTFTPKRLFSWTTLLDKNWFENNRGPSMNTDYILFYKNLYKTTALISATPRTNFEALTTGDWNSDDLIPFSLSTLTPKKTFSILSGDCSLNSDVSFSGTLSSVYSSRSQFAYTANLASLYYADPSSIYRFIHNLPNASGNFSLVPTALNWHLNRELVSQKISAILHLPLLSSLIVQRPSNATELSLTASTPAALLSASFIQQLPGFAVNFSTSETCLRNFSKFNYLIQVTYTAASPICKLRTQTSLKAFTSQTTVNRWI